MDVDSYIQELQSAAKAAGWQLHGSKETLLWLYWSGQTSCKRLYLSAGIHGDEPAGPAAVLELVKEADWLKDLEVWIFPLLNPEGLKNGQRENPEGLDLNRDYNQAKSQEIIRHLEVLKTLPRFDACLCLHEDWEAAGCYLYFLREDPGPAWAIPLLQAMARHIPVEMNPMIDGFEAVEGRIERNQAMIDRPEWAEALYLARKHTHCCFTLETPSSFPLEKRTASLRDAVQAVAAKLREVGASN